MKHVNKNWLYTAIVILVLSITLNSCDETTNTPGQYTNGVFVMNEGAFGSSNSEISFIANDNSVYNNLYGNNNSSAILGDVFQSMHIANGNAYLVINNSSKVEVVDINNLQSKGTISGLESPRYMVTYNGNGYITDWNNFSGAGILWVVNLSNNSITDSISLGVQPEQMMVVGSNILVTDASDTTIRLVNTSNLSVTNIGDVDNPRYIQQTNDNNIWILYTGDLSFPGPTTDGGLLVLNSTATAIVKDINIGSTSFQNPSQLATDGTNLYYEYQGNVYKIDKDATVAPSTPFLTAPATSLYGLNYYQPSNTLYVADAKNYVSAGVVKRYNAGTGSLIDTVNVGVCPNGFVFN